jgi:hypothetical protein
MVNGRRSPDGTDVDGLVAQTQSRPVPTAHGRVDGGRRPDGEEADGSWGMTDGDSAAGSIGADGEPVDSNDVAGLGDPGDIAATSAGDGARVPESRGGGGVREDRGDAEGKEEPAEAKGVEGWSVADGP